MMKPILFGLLVAASPLLTNGAFADPRFPYGAHTISDTDRTFLEKAAGSTLAEIKLGAMAASRGTAAPVRQFGQRMIDDHRRAGEELNRLAAAKGVMLPPAIPAEAQALCDQLAGLSGAEFDRAFTEAMGRAHDQDLMMFRRQVEVAVDPDVKAWAQKTLPTLRQHDDLVHTMPMER